MGRSTEPSNAYVSVSNSEEDVIRCVARIKPYGAVEHSQRLSV